MHKLTENGYILAVSETASEGTEITEQEYNDIMSILQNRPQPKDGFSLMLNNSNLQWEYMPIEPIEEEASPDDYEQALEEMGVDFND